MVLTMSDHPRHTDFSQGSDPLDQTIETTIPVKKSAADLPSDDFFRRTGFKPIYATGSAGDALAGRVEGIHVFGDYIVSRKPLSGCSTQSDGMSQISSLSRLVTKRSVNTSQRYSTWSGRLTTKSKRRLLRDSILTACRLPGSTYHRINEPERVGTRNSFKLTPKSSQSSD